MTFLIAHCALRQSDFVIIEISTNRGWKTDFNKMRRLIDETEYGIEEGFVYNFELDIWHKYAKKYGVYADPTGFSDVLGLDLSQFV